MTPARQKLEATTIEHVKRAAVVDDLQKKLDKALSKKWHALRAMDDARIEVEAEEKKVKP